MGKNQDITKKMVWGLIPFFYSKHNQDAREHLDYLTKTVNGLKKAGVDKVIVVDDGSGMELKKLNLDCELLTHEKNQGKTEAILTGLKFITNQDGGSGYIVQCDYDADQKSEDAELLLTKFQENMTGNLGLVIGDRYKEAQQDPLDYRKVMLYFQKVLCKQMGYNLEDTVSGLRAYTTDFGNKFLSNSRSKGFGSDTEQLVIAFIEKMEVSAVPLTYSRRRSISTPNEKLVEVMNAVLCHKKELVDRELGNLINLFKLIKRNLENKENSFEIDLSELGEKTKITFKISGGGKYTAELQENKSENNEIRRFKMK